MPTPQSAQCTMTRPRRGDSTSFANRTWGRRIGCAEVAQEAFFEAPVLSTPPGTAPAAVPVDRSNLTADAPRARPISPVAKIAADDGALLAEVAVPARTAAATPPVVPAPKSQTPPGSLVSVNRDDADFVFLEPRKKTWVVIRSGPGGQPLYEDFLYPSAKPMRLPPGKYFIELKEADAVAIVRNGKRISYMAPGVLVQ